ncbi:GumC family protein [Shewanella phaeophyticola]|uniref:GumC family protein n=1 Tax=Shewanella phaeophyticola TaxID=2978345 RepID=A0ABT2P310_9GAMM|nr:GumC family protein [Shewanella sp. KJ10-1]MCT8987043.1 GumC family protein [Shewanella sp. KJ10-1]
MLQDKQKTIYSTDMVDSSLIQTEQLVDIKKILFPILRFKWRIFLFAVLITALAVFIVLSMIPIYKASSMLLIESEQAKAIKIDEVYGINSGQQEYYLTQFEIIKSRSIAERVFNSLNLIDHPAFNQPPSMFEEFKSQLKFIPQELTTVDSQISRELTKHQMIDSFTQNISISPIRKTQLVRISYESPDPKLAAEVANAVGDTYIISQLEAKLGMTQKANAWLGGRLEDLRLNLNLSESKLEKFKFDNGLIDVEGVTALDAKELERLSDEITVARSRLAQAESFMAVVKRYGDTDISRLESLPEVTSHQSIQNVKREVVLVERKVSELQQVYGPKHPKMIAALAELSAVQQNLHKQISRLVQGIEDEAQTAEQNLRALESQFRKAKGAYQNLSTKDTDYQRLLREVDTNRQLFDSFLARQKETAVTGDFDSPVARFTDSSRSPTNTSKTK